MSELSNEAVRYRVGHYSNCDSLWGDDQACSCRFDDRLNNAINESAFRLDEEQLGHIWEPYGTRWQVCSRCGVVGGTDRQELNALRERFGIYQHLDFYSEEELAQIATRSAAILETAITPDDSHEPSSLISPSIT